jgi:hypothetical protein
VRLGGQHPLDPPAQARVAGAGPVEVGGPLGRVGDLEGGEIGGLGG